MKSLYPITLLTLLLTGFDNTATLLSDRSIDRATNLLSNDTNIAQTVEEEHDTAPAPTKAHTDESDAFHNAIPSENMNLYTKAEIDNIVNNIIRPTAYKIKGMVDNKQISPVSKTNVETTYKVDDITLVIYNDGTLYAEYTYYNDQLFVVVPYVNKQLKNRYYYYNNDLIYILYPDKSDKYRPSFTEQDMQLGINALNYQF